ncbi:hypothetical protein INR49_017383 [Xyrichtys novacula]|uniref:Uncharacterized protein n=1 Tax=Xyrichtys novacula TaxID=13765 RepID=A0AAV1G7J7_XYRNO|nr:hypothetical protein INR49_017383 [Xyrichtys novacula]
MFSSLQIATVLLGISLHSLGSSAYELHDTINTLQEENLHLQYRLENLTRALRDLKHLLIENSRVSGRRREADFLNVWKEWFLHGISTETHQMLQQTLCLTEPHSAAQPILPTPCLLYLSALVFWIFLS